jgi:hypothetical protein
LEHQLQTQKPSVKEQFIFLGTQGMQPGWEETTTTVSATEMEVSKTSG